LLKIEIKEPSTPDEFEAIEEIQIDAWGMKDIDVVPSRLAIAIHEAGGCIFIAYINKKPIGYVLGFIAKRNNEIYLHSHQVGVKRKFWGKGVGFRLKLKQREWALEKGINLIRWTFDPLMSRNAYFNFYKLGVINNTYKINLYGEMHDELNKGMETDRFYVEWWLNSERVKERIKGLRLPEEVKMRLEKLPKAIIIRIENGLITPEETRLNLNKKAILVPIPYDINEIKRKDIKVAIEWRKATRDIFTHYFSKGYIAVDFLAEKNKGIAYYILIREKKENILKSKWWEKI